MELNLKNTTRLLFSGTLSRLVFFQLLLSTALIILGSLVALKIIRYQDQKMSHIVKIETELKGIYQDFEQSVLSTRPNTQIEITDIKAAQTLFQSTLLRLHDLDYLNHEDISYTYLENIFRALHSTAFEIANLEVDRE